jgi:hypothetical protein
MKLSFDHNDKNRVKPDEREHYQVFLNGHEILGLKHWFDPYDGDERVFVSADESKGRICFYKKTMPGCSKPYILEDGSQEPKLFSVDGIVVVKIVAVYQMKR